MLTARYPKQIHNFIAFGLDYIFFGLALSLISPTTILPAFATRLGASNALVGLLVTVFYLAWDLPQLFAGNIIARRPTKKPTLLWMAYVGRPVVWLFALLLILTGGNPAWLNMGMLFVVLAVLFSTDAFAAIAWFDVLGRAFPSEKRGGYLSIWQVAKALAVLGGASLVGYVLSDRGPGFPDNYALLFGLGGGAFLISGIALALIYEPPATADEPASTHIEWKDFGLHLIRIWREDSRLRRATISRILLVLSAMASPFYVLYATDVQGFPIRAVGFFISAQTVGGLVGSLVLGRVADRWGARRAIQIAMFFVLSAPLLALALALSSGEPAALLRRFYAWIYICIGVIENLVILGYMNYVLDAAPPGQRTIYMGTTNAISGVGVLGPVFAGWLLSQTSYGVLFAVALAFGLGASWLALRLPDARRREADNERPMSVHAGPEPSGADPA